MIDWKVAMLSVVLQGIGVWLGIWAASFLNTSMLKKCIAAMCIGTGVMMLLRQAGLFF